MSTIFSMATNLSTWYRVTALILDSATPAGSHTASRQPIRASCMQVQLSGSPTGTVTISGTVDGVADTEVLTWTGTAANRATWKAFTAVSGISTSLSGATAIEITAVGSDGSPQVDTVALKEGWPISYRDYGIQSYRQESPGNEKKASGVMLVAYDETWKPREGDVVTLDTGETYDVAGVPTTGGGLQPDHWKVRVNRREGAV